MYACDQGIHGSRLQIDCEFFIPKRISYNIRTKWLVLYIMSYIIRTIVVSRKKAPLQKKLSFSSDSAQKIYTLLQNKLSLPQGELQKGLEEILSLLKEKETFPISTLHEKLTVLESVVKYLKEEQSYNLRKIAEVLGRNEKNIWHAYHNATQKVPAPIRGEPSSILVPVEIFSENKLAPLESLVVFLKDQHNISFAAVARLLSRNASTIRTSYTRAKKKDESKK